MPIITTDLVALDVDAGGDKESGNRLLAGRLADAGRSVEVEEGRHGREATGRDGVAVVS